MGTIESAQSSIASFLELASGLQAEVDQKDASYAKANMRTGAKLPPSYPVSAWSRASPDELFNRECWKSCSQRLNDLSGSEKYPGYFFDDG